jgi:hypothetical protein
MEDLMTTSEEIAKYTGIPHVGMPCAVPEE